MAARIAVSKAISLATAAMKKREGRSLAASQSAAALLARAVTRERVQGVAISSLHL